MKNQIWKPYCCAGGTGSNCTVKSLELGQDHAVQLLLVKSCNSENNRMRKAPAPVPCITLSKSFVQPDAQVFYLRPECDDEQIQSGVVECVYNDGSADIVSDVIGCVGVNLANIFETREAAIAAHAHRSGHVADSDWSLGITLNVSAGIANPMTPTVSVNIPLSPENTGLANLAQADWSDVEPTAYNLATAWLMAMRDNLSSALGEPSEASV